jgi:hypothetical protein
MVATTENLVCNLIALTYIAHDNLFAFGDHDAVNGAGIVCSPRTAPTESFNLQSIYAVGQFDESC